MLMKKQFQSLTEKGRWLLATLTLIFTLSIGQMWGEDFTFTATTGSYLSPGNLVKVTMAANSNPSSGRVDTKSSKTGGFTVSSNAPGIYVKKITFTDSQYSGNKKGTITCENGGTLAVDGSGNYTITANANTTSVEIKVVASSSGDCKITNLSLEVTNGSVNNIETLSGFTFSSGTFSFTSKVNGSSVTPTVGLTSQSSSSWSASSNNISVPSSSDSKTLTITATSGKHLKYVAFYDSNCRLSLVEKSSTGGSCSGAAWTAANNTTTSVTFKNGISTSITVTKVYVITEDDPAATTHALQWNFDGGSCSATAGTDYTAAGQVAEGATITYPAASTMSKDGKDFAGWSSSATTMPTSDLTITALWEDHTTSNDATLSELSVAGCTFNETFDPATLAYTVDLPFYASMPAASAVTATKNDANASDPVVSISGNVISVEVTPESGAGDKKTYTITVNIAAAPSASSSINIEQLVLDNSKAYNIGAALTAANISYVDKDALDSLKNQSGRNEPYLGLKFKKTTSKVTIIVPASTALNVKFGYIDGSAGFKVSVNGSTPAAPSLTSGVYTIAASAGVKEVVFTQTAAKTVVYKQIMVGEDIQSVQLPWLVTYDAGEHGTCATAKEVWWGTALTLPTVTPEEGWSFDGWKDDENNAATSPYTPTKDVVLSAQYTALASPFDLTALTYKIGTAEAVNVGYEDGTFTYNIELPYAQYDAITVAPTLKESSSSLKGDEVLTVSSLPGAATFTVVAAGGSSEQLYTVNFSKAPKDGVCLVWADVPADNTLTYNATNSKFYAESDVTLQNSNVKGKDGSAPSGKKFQSNGFLKIALNEGTFLEGDVVALNVTYGTANVMHVFKAQAATSTDVIGEAAGNTDAGLNKVTITEDASTLWLVRGGEYADWNPHVDYVAVYRAMNPVLTAITIDERAGVIDPLDDKHFNVQIPYEANLANLTIASTVVRNAAHATTPEAVISNEGAWVIGDNTYRVMDKDGDYTDYTITLTRDVLKHTVSFNTHGGSAVANEEVEHNAYLAAAPTAPTKEDYIFQYWSLTDGGEEVDITTVQINEDKEFHAVWEAEPAGIKLFTDLGLNTTNFISAAKAEDSVVISEVKYPCLVNFASNRSSLAGAKQGDLVMYSATTDAAKIKFDLYNANGSAKTAYVWLVEEGDDAATQLDAIEIAGETRVKTAYYEFNGTKNRTVYLTSGSKADIKVLQAKVIESGNAIKQFGQAGYSLNLNKGRIASATTAPVQFEGATITVSSEYSVLNSSNLATKAANSFNVTSPVIMHVERSGGKYYVYQDPADKGTLYSANADVELNTTGTWYFSSESASSAASFTLIRFDLPKAAKPVVDDMANVDYCQGSAIDELAVSATVSDGGTKLYQWYKDGVKIDGAEAATYQPEGDDADGEYYVVVVNTKADHQNSDPTQSNTITVTGHAGTVISGTTGAEDWPDADVTISVTASGKNLSYAWYTCDDAMGTNPVAVDPAVNAAELDVTVGAVDSYYKVVVSGDCGSAQEAVITVVARQAVALQDVTGNMKWDFSKANDGSAATSSMCNDEVLANVTGIVNNSDFKSDNIKATANKFSGGKLQASMIKFHTTVPGAVIVKCANTGGKDHYRYLEVNGVQTELGSKDGTVQTYAEYVQAGDVVLTVTTADGGNMFNFTSVEFKVDNDLEPARTDDWLAPGELGTICIPQGAVAVGADIYELVGKEPQYGKIVFESVEHMKPGKPYLFQAKGTRIDFILTDETPATAPEDNEDNAMKGTFEQLYITGADLENVYYFADHALWSCVDLMQLDVPANRAYVRMDLVKPLSNQNSAPGRRRITLGVNGQNSATGIGEIEASETPMKVIIEGQLFIIRGEKMFDVTGKLVK